MVISFSHGSTALVDESEKLEDLEAMPEYVREARTHIKDSYAANKASYVADDVDLQLPPKSAELEALWPGVSQDIFHMDKAKAPSLYLTIGFMAGAVASMVVMWGFTWVTHAGVNIAQNIQQSKKIVVAQGTNPMNGTIASEAAVVTTKKFIPTSNEVVVPLTPTYEVKSGDTLASIALSTYKRATPRLLDEICKANGMRNANVLSMGQKLTLPEYHPQVAAAGRAM